MRRVLAACLLVAVMVTPVRADPSRCPLTVWQGAIGGSVGWQDRRDYGDRTRGAFVPELLFLAYRPLGVHDLYLRPGARLGYRGLDGPEMPGSLGISERDLTLGTELGILADGVVVPSITLGAALVWQHVSLDTAAPIVEADETIDGDHLMPSAYAQLGVGLPLVRGLLILEPFVRFELTAGDDRSHLRYGLELTVQLF